MITKIFDLHYEKAYSQAGLVKCDCCHLAVKKCEAKLNLLLQYEYLFNGALDTSHTKPVHLELKKDAVFRHQKAFLVAKFH